MTRRFASVNLLNFVARRFSPLAQKVRAAEHRNKRHDRSSPRDDGRVSVLRAYVGHAPHRLPLHIDGLVPHHELEVLQHPCNQTRECERRSLRSAEDKLRGTARVMISARHSRVL